MTTSITEMEAIRKAASLYYEGLQTGNIDVLKKAFHPKAMMYGPGMIVEIQGLFDYVAANQPPAKTGENHQCLVTKIDCMGKAASVEVLQHSYLGVSYINYFQLLKLEGNWIIVSKSFDVIENN